MPVLHKIDDYLYKNRTIYHVVPYWEMCHAQGYLASVFLKETTSEILRSP